MYLTRILTTLVILSLSLSFTGCFKDLDEIGWDTEVVTPIAKTSLTVLNMVDDTSNYSEGANGQVSIVYREPIYTYSNPLDSLVNIQIRPLIKDVTLQSLELSPQSFESGISLGEIIGDDFLLRLLFPDQTKIPNALGGTNIEPDVDPIAVDLSNFLESAVLTDGVMDLELTNNLPLDLTSLDFIIENTASQTVIHSGSYVINSGQTIIDQVDLAQVLGSTPIEGNITISLSNVRAEAPTGVDSLFIDYSDAFSAKMTLSNLKVSEATAVFPAQNLVEAKDTVSLMGMGDVEIIRAIIKSGNVSAVVGSTVEAGMEMEYYIPSATLQGNMFSFLADVPAAPPGGKYTFDENFPYDGYEFDFTGKDGTLTNTFYNELYARIDSTGELVYLSLTDTLSMEIRVDKMIPSYVEGYFGQESYNIPSETVNVDFLKAMKSGSVEFEDAKLNLVIENGIGLDGDITFNSLVARNTTSGETFNFPTLNTFNISEATNTGSGFVPSEQSLEVPNAATLLNILPDEISYSISGSFNPGGNVPAYNDFIYEDSELNALLELEIPLSLKATNLLLIDTVTFNDQVVQSPEEVSEGVVRFIVTNSFPFETELKAYFLRPNLTVSDSLIGAVPITSGLVTDVNSPATPQETILEFNVAQNKLQNILNSTQILLEVKFNSDGTDYVKIFNQSAIDVQITADFKYTVKTDF